MPKLPEKDAEQPERYAARAAWVQTAERIARAAHAGQTDKAGRPYIEHPLAVAAQLDTDEEVAAALLHDVLEDTDRTEDDLRRAGIPERVLEAVRLLTHQDGVPYLDYVRALRGNPIARRVKRADLRHNSDLSRLPSVGERERTRLARYQAAIRILEDSEEEPTDGTH